RWSCTSSSALIRWLTEERGMNRPTRAIAFTVAVAVMLAVSVSTPRAQTAGERIGQVTFPTSCVVSVQKPFERGVAPLHSFPSPDPAKPFTPAPHPPPDPPTP